MEVYIYERKGNQSINGGTGKAPSVTTIINELSSLQKAVSVGADYVGYIEIIGIDDNVCILCNEEGKLINLKPNRRFYDDILCGVFYVVGEDDDGKDRDVDNDYGGYVLYAEPGTRDTEVLSWFDYEEYVLEYVEYIDSVPEYCCSLYLTSTEYGVVVLTALADTPEEITDELQG